MGQTEASLGHRDCVGSLLGRLWAGILMTAGWFRATTGSPTSSGVPSPVPPPTHCPAASRGRVIPGGRIEPRLSSARGPIRVHVMLGSVSLGALYSGPIPTPQGQMPAVWDMPVVPSAGDRGTGLCTQGAPRSGCEVPPASLGTLRGLASASFSLKLKKNNPKQGVRVTECV